MDRVRAACQAFFPTNKGDCNAFARSVAGSFGVALEGPADHIVDTIRSVGTGWTIQPDGISAARQAANKSLVLAGLKGAEQTIPNVHGHVVVVVDGPVAEDKYPRAYWGSLGGEPGEDKTINFAWKSEDRDRVTYASFLIAENDSASETTVLNSPPLTDVAAPLISTADPQAHETSAGKAIPFLEAAIRAAAPQADATLWAHTMEPHLVSSDIATPRRVAAFLGQAAVEAGASLSELAENMFYSHPERLCAVFPSRFPSLAIARTYVGDPRRTASRAYSGKLGNGDEASGDGWEFRGSGLLQITGRATFEAFAKILSAPVEQVVEWTRTLNGAAASACWYWRLHKLNLMADAWDLASITLAVNGHAMSAHAQRVVAAEAALRAAKAVV